VKPFSLSLGEHVRSGYLVSGQTIGALALALGIDAPTLTATLARYNQGAQAR
jgi:hypothetical protein